MPNKDKSVSDYLDEIIALVQERSGYPYPEGSTESPNRALAYGLAWGSLAWAKREFESGLRPK